ncbi:MAG: peptidylprolyl isomerase [candidate division Zixibacteria bacterium]|nr:peptidylprolyl isomerase [candidate division Zixibacteria bacterium]
MKQADLGDTVKIHYIGKLENGLIFDCTRDNEPFEIQVGSGKSVPGFEMGLTGMAIGDKRTIAVSPEDGFGLRDEKLSDKINKSDLPDNITIAVGKQLMMPHSDGEFIRATITEIQSDSITVDLNHPLAGRKLIFEVEMLEIVESS